MYTLKKQQIDALLTQIFRTLRKHLFEVPGCMNGADVLQSHWKDPHLLLAMRQYFTKEEKEKVDGNAWEQVQGISSQTFDWGKMMNACQKFCRCFVFCQFSQRERIMQNSNSECNSFEVVCSKPVTQKPP